MGCICRNAAASLRSSVFTLMLATQYLADSFTLLHCVDDCAQRNAEGAGHCIEIAVLHFAIDMDFSKSRVRFQPVQSLCILPQPLHFVPERINLRYMAVAYYKCLIECG